MIKIARHLKRNNMQLAVHGLHVSTCKHRRTLHPLQTIASTGNGINLIKLTNILCILLDSINYASTKKNAINLLLNPTKLRRKALEKQHYLLKINKIFIKVKKRQKKIKKKPALGRELEGLSLTWRRVTVLPLPRRLSTAHFNAYWLPLSLSIATTVAFSSPFFSPLLLFWLIIIISEKNQFLLFLSFPFPFFQDIRGLLLRSHVPL